MSPNYQSPTFQPPGFRALFPSLRSGASAGSFANSAPFRATTPGRYARTPGRLFDPTLLDRLQSRLSRYRD